MRYYFKINLIYVFSFFAVFIFKNNFSLALDKLNKNSENVNREFALIIGEDGIYYPSTVVLYEQETIRVLLTKIRGESGCMILPEQDIFLSAYSGQITEKILSFPYPGAYPFYCPGQNYQGKFLVLPRRSNQGSGDYEGRGSEGKIKGVTFRRKSHSSYGEKDPISLLEYQKENEDKWRPREE